jgi:hypothetical protein
MKTFTISIVPEVKKLKPKQDEKLMRLALDNADNAIIYQHKTNREIFISEDSDLSFQSLIRLIDKIK